MIGPAVGIAAALGAAAYAARGRSSSVFAPSVYRGSSERRAIALTFDDGPTPATRELLRVLERYQAKATFFQCGMHVRRLPGVSRDLLAAGHELGNHSETHARLWLRSPQFIYREIAAAQQAIADATGEAPKFFRAPYGVRWPGLHAAQSRLGLLGVMWTAIAMDWKLPGEAVAERLLRNARNGAIFCLHDGRERNPDPDIASTIEAVRTIVPALLDQGYELVTVSSLLRVE